MVEKNRERKLWTDAWHAGVSRGGRSEAGKENIAGRSDGRGKEISLNKLADYATFSSARCIVWPYGGGVFISFLAARTQGGIGEEEEWREWERVLESCRQSRKCSRRPSPATPRRVFILATIYKLHVYMYRRSCRKEGRWVWSFCATKQHFFPLFLEHISGIVVCFPVAELSRNAASIDLTLILLKFHLNFPQLHLTVLFKAIFLFSIQLSE